MLCYNCMRDKGESDVCPYCHTRNTGALQPHHISPGSVIANRYTLGRVLGEGGFGITYLGMDNTLGTVIAVKEYYPFGFCNRNNTVTNTVSIMSEDKKSFYDRGLVRFLREARILAKFQVDSGVVNVLDYVEENNTAYIVMEYLDGITLREYLKNNGPIDPELAVQMLLPAMRALKKIHDAGVIHRDVSPDNIMMMRDGSLKLMDFGAAQIYDGDARSMSIMLKQGYAPEEQYRRNGEQGPWTDVYGMCATVYRCITGSAPVEAMDRVYKDTLVKPSQRGVDISPALENTIMYGLAVHKENRCPDMGVLIDLTEQALSGQESTVAADPQDSRSREERIQDERQKLDLTMLADKDAGRSYQDQYQYRDMRQDGQNGYNYPPRDDRLQYPPQPPVQQKNSYAPLIVGICLAVAALIAVVVVIIAVKFGDSGSGTSAVSSVVSSSSSSSQAVSSSKAEIEDAVVDMPDLTGLSKEAAISKLSEYNLSVSEFVETETDEQKPGKVFNQVPKKGASVTGDTKITLYIAKAKPTSPPTPSSSSKPVSSSKPDPAPQSNYLYSTARTYVTLHQSASLSSKSIGKIWKGQRVTYISSSSGWYYVDTGSVRGYASASYLSSGASDVPNSSGEKLYVDSDIDYLSLRQTASENATELIRIPAGKALTFLNGYEDHGYVRSDGYHVQWAYVSYGGYTGYVYDYYLHD